MLKTVPWFKPCAKLLLSTAVPTRDHPAQPEEPPVTLNPGRRIWKFGFVSVGRAWRGEFFFKLQEDPELRATALDAARSERENFHL